MPQIEPIQFPHSDNLGSTHFPSWKEFQKKKICIVGAGITGISCAAALNDLEIPYAVTDENPRKSQELVERFPQAEIEILPWDVKQIEHCDLLLASPGIPPHSPIFPAQIPVYGDYELAWWCNEWEIFGPRKSWLAITGTNGKTTTVMMCEAILQQAGIKVMSCGNIGTPILDVLRLHPEMQYLLVEMSSFQLHYAPSFRPTVGVVLNIAPDHIDWHGSFADYVQAKYRVLQGELGIINLDDPVTAELIPARRKIALTLAIPQPGQLGIDEAGFLVDNAFSDLQYGSLPLPIISKEQISPTSPAGWMDALAAIAIARSIGIGPGSIAAALAQFTPAAHRGEIVYKGEIAGNRVILVDNSKATNPHASINAIQDLQGIYPDYRQILLMGGQLKGADITELVKIAARVISIVIVFGMDSGIICEAFSQHAPNIMVICLLPGEDNRQDDPILMQIEDADGIPVYHLKQRHDHLLECLIPQVKWNGAAVMRLATQIAFDQSKQYQSSLILLAPAAASLDMFSGYAQRGELFQQSVHKLISR